MTGRRARVAVPLALVLAVGVAAGALAAADLVAEVVLLAVGGLIACGSGLASGRFSGVAAGLVLVGGAIAVAVARHGALEQAIALALAGGALFVAAERSTWLLDEAAQREPGWRVGAVVAGAGAVSVALASLPRLGGGPAALVAGALAAVALALGASAAIASRAEAR